jgi:hypothetical protein
VFQFLRVASVQFIHGSSELLKIHSKAVRIEFGGLSSTVAKRSQNISNRTRVTPPKLKGHDQL